MTQLKFRESRARSSGVLCEPGHIRIRLRPHRITTRHMAMEIFRDGELEEEVRSFIVRFSTLLGASC